MMSVSERLREILQYREREPYLPNAFSIVASEAKRAPPFQHTGRYAIIPYETEEDIRELHEYLLGYQARRRTMLDVQRQRLRHPFGDVDHFAIIYRHLPFFETLGVATPPGRHSWRIPQNQIAGWGMTIAAEGGDFNEFIRILENRIEVTKSWFGDEDFRRDVEELGSTYVRVVGNSEFYLESNYTGESQEWRTKWMMLKLRWT